MAEFEDLLDSCEFLLDKTSKLLSIGHTTIFTAGGSYEDDLVTLDTLDGMVSVLETSLAAARDNPDAPWNKAILKRLDTRLNEDSPLKHIETITKALETDVQEWEGRQAKGIKTETGPTEKRKLAKKFDKLNRKWQEIDSIFKRSQSIGHMTQLSVQQDQYEKALKHPPKPGRRSTTVSESSEFTKDTFEFPRSNASPPLGKLTRFESLEDTVRTDIEDRRQRREVKKENEIRKAIMQWLSPLDFLARQRNIYGALSNHFSPGQWFLNSEEFKRWADEAQEWQLRCYGDTGAGKV